MDNVTVYFCNFRREFINILSESSKEGTEKITIVGCIAWLSDPEILEALSYYCVQVFFLVNDEDFNCWGNGKTHLLYDKLPWCYKSVSELFGHLNDVYLPLTVKSSFAPVRCIKKNGAGNHLMHNKYVVILSQKKEDKALTCVSTWLGSVNFTKNSSNNLESATYIEDERVAKSVFDDFSNLFILSSPLSVCNYNDVGGSEGNKESFEYCDVKGRYIFKG